MSRPSPRPLVCALALILVTGPFTAADEAPNVVIIFTDDQGYADVGTFGAKGFRTPHLDRMASEGIRFTNFHVSQPVCSASRASLLTGCYSNRIGIHGALGPRTRHGLNTTEMTIAELVKQKSYATAIFGKWHLGHHPEFLPLRHGFDEYYGLPYSNDMWRWHPTGGAHYPPLPLIEGEKIIEYDPDQRQLTTSYTERAVSFIEKSKGRPFFLYVPHSMPHVPLFVSDKFRGKSENGLYGDVIMEIDWSVGQILDALKRTGVDENTLVMFISDNGPWLSYGDHGGSALPLREGKGTTWEGGVRVPCVMRWPAKIPAGSVCTEPAMTIDVLPTIAQITGTKLPEHGVDGKSILELMSGRADAKSPQEAYYLYYRNNELQAILSGKWKLHLPHAYRTLEGRKGGTNGRPVRYGQGRTRVELYDLDSDVAETTDVAAKHPEIVARLQAYAERARADLGDRLTKRKGSGVREPGYLATPKR